MNTTKFKRLVENLLKEENIEEAVDTLGIQKSKSEEGNTQITLSVLGAGFNDNQLTLSIEEAKELQKLAKEFASNRNSKLSKGVNTPDDNSTQSIISIEPDKLSCIISRKEGSVYKGYDKPVEAEAGYLKAQQSIVYQIVDELGKNLEESIEEDINAVPPNNPAAKTSDVKNIVKYIETKSDFISRLEKVSNGQEVTEFLSFILNKINPKVSGVNKNALMNIIKDRFK